MKDPILAETPSTSLSGVEVAVGVDETVIDTDPLDVAVLPVADEPEKLVDDELKDLEDELAPSW